MAEAEKDLKSLHTELDKVIKQAKARARKPRQSPKRIGRTGEKAKKIPKRKSAKCLAPFTKATAEDEDLKRAVKNANSALDHLRDYLKK